MLEVAPVGHSLASIYKRAGGHFMLQFKDVVLNFLRHQQPDDDECVARRYSTFARSCAAYCVATYVLCVTDRHNDNLMVRVVGDCADFSLRLTPSIHFEDCQLWSLFSRKCGLIYAVFAT